MLPNKSVVNLSLCMQCPVFILSRKQFYVVVFFVLTVLNSLICISLYSNLLRRRVWSQVHMYTVYLEYHSVCMSPRPNWDRPLSRKLMCTRPHPGTKGVGTLACGWGSVGDPNPNDWRKSLAVCLLCGPYYLDNSFMLFSSSSLF